MLIHPSRKVAMIQHHGELGNTSVSSRLKKKKSISPNKPGLRYP